MFWGITCFHVQDTSVHFYLLNRMADVSGVFVDCQICENKDYDLCLFAVDQGVIYRDDLNAEGGQMLVIIDTIIPFLDNEIKALPYGKKLF